MDALLDFMRGPLLAFALMVLILGLARQVILGLWGIGESLHRASDRQIPFGRVIRTTMTWVFPVTRLHRSKPVFSYASFFFHLGVILSALFLQEHIDLLSGLGLSWPSIPRPLIDWIALLGLAGLIIILLYRIYVRQSRAVSGFLDYFILVLLILTVGMGYLAGQSWNVIPYKVTMLIHMGTGATILVLFPFTKLAHCALYPLVRLSSEVGWRFTQEGGSDVVKTLWGPEGRKI